MYAYTCTRICVRVHLRVRVSVKNTRTCTCILSVCNGRTFFISLLQISRSPEELLSDLSDALYRLTTSTTTCDVSFSDLLIRYEEVLRTANYGISAPVVVSTGEAELQQQIETTRVRSNNHICHIHEFH